jgi:hypothetical protein
MLEKGFVAAREQGLPEILVQAHPIPYGFEDHDENNPARRKQPQEILFQCRGSRGYQLCGARQIAGADGRPDCYANAPGRCGDRP